MHTSWKEGDGTIRVWKLSLQKEHDKRKEKNLFLYWTKTLVLFQKSISWSSILFVTNSQLKLNFQCPNSCEFEMKQMLTNISVEIKFIEVIRSKKKTLNSAVLNSWLIFYLWKRNNDFFRSTRLLLFSSFV